MLLSELNNIISYISNSESNINIQNLPVLSSNLLNIFNYYFNIKATYWTDYYFIGNYTTNDNLGNTI